MSNSIVVGNNNNRNNHVSKCNRRLQLRCRHRRLWQEQNTDGRMKRCTSSLTLADLVRPEILLHSCVRWPISILKWTVPRDHHFSFGVLQLSYVNSSAFSMIADWYTGVNSPRMRTDKLFYIIPSTVPDWEHIAQIGYYQHGYYKIPWY